MSLSDSSDDEFGAINFLTTAATRNQAKFKSKTPIRRQRERSTSSSSSSSVSSLSPSICSSEKEETVNEVSILEVVDVTPKTKPRTRRRRRQSSKKPKNTSRKENSIIELSNDELDSLPSTKEEDNKVIKILWNYEIHRISIHRTAKISDLTRNFAENLSISPEDLLISLNNKPMCKDSSVEEIKVVDILHACKGIQDEDIIELKIQDGKSREPVMVKIKPSETVSSLIEMYICKKNDSIKFEEVSLFFDGEVLEKKESLKELDFEGGECIDIVIRQANQKQATPKKVTQYIRRSSRRRKY